MKLLVHIGANKTGSSAVQEFLSENVAPLDAEGITVPDGGLEVGSGKKRARNHVPAFRDILNDPHGRDRFGQLMTSLLSKAKGVSTVVLSAENLAENQKAPDLFAALTEKFDIQVILYIRRQDEYLLSAWQQWNSKVNGDFWAWLISVVGNMGNWQRILQNWERVVPRENITVRIFDRARLKNGDIVEDFCEQVGLARPFDEYARSAILTNPSYSDAITDLVKGNSLVFDDVHDNDFYNFVREMTGEQYLKKKKRSSITFAQRQAIQNRYRATNRWVNKNYFSRDDDSLFSPLRSEDFEYVPTGMWEDEKLKFLTTVVYRMYKELAEGKRPRER